MGTFPLRYVVDTPIGSTEFTQQVRLEDKGSILLTTEKPIYQPGQTIHVRALALDRSNHEATAGRNLTFEVEDSRGNKVFKKSTQTSKFGIASAEFALADEVNLGTYHLRAITESGDGSTHTAETRLERRALRAAEIQSGRWISAARISKAKHGYRPGDHVTGTVRANYFFGKPVDRCRAHSQGLRHGCRAVRSGVRRRKDGSRTARIVSISSCPIISRAVRSASGAARVLIEATVKDSAGHAETRGEPITVSESPLIVTAVPEGGTLIPDLENQVFILTSYADGKPASADVGPCRWNHRSER